MTHRAAHDPAGEPPDRPGRARTKSGNHTRNVPEPFSYGSTQSFTSPGPGHPPRRFLTPLAPLAGEHVTVTGPLVWDSNLLHDLIYPGRDVRDWAEIYPAWNITIGLPASTSAAH
jgi:hypothetical protein